MKKKQKTKKQEKEEAEKYITLSLKCPSCNWEWSGFIDCSSPHLSTQCPNCFHQPIYLISLM
jgi:transcription elongation factor Elf1